MTTPRTPMLAVFTLAALLMPAVAAADGAGTLLYERTLMVKADARCRLFTPDIATALAASAVQARGATLRSGVNEAGVRQIEDRAALKAYAVSCALPDLKIAADRVRKAFDGYAALRDMSFPGTVASWDAVRTPWPLVVKGKVRPGPRWRLSQRSGPLVFGIAAGSSLTAVTTAPDAAQASGARLVMRDPAKAADAFINPRRNDLQGRIPPRSVSQVYLAASIGSAPESLSPQGAPPAVMVTFPPSAAQAMAGLDPREGVSLELVFPTRTGERVETSLIEVGDFAAGRAFLAAGR